MEDIVEQLAIRDRAIRHRWQSKTPAQRVQEMIALQEASRRLLRSSPEGYTHFLRRNFKARAIDVTLPESSMAPELR
jgi:hypothetical protein